MKTFSRKNGFSLIELMAAVLVGAVLALTAGAMMVFSYMSWSFNTASVKMQNDASIAMLVISRAVRESSIHDILIDGVPYSENPMAIGSELVFLANAVRSNNVSIVESGNRLVFEPSGFILVEDGARNGLTAQFNPNGPKVEIRLRVRGSRNVGDTTLNATFTPRN